MTASERIRAARAAREFAEIRAFLDARARGEKPKAVPFPLRPTEPGEYRKR